MTSSFDRVAARERCQAATPGPWTAHYACGLHDDAAAWIGAPGVTESGLYVAAVSNTTDGLNDAAFIAAARTDLVAALDALDRVLALCDGNQLATLRKARVRAAIAGPRSGETRL